MLNKISPVRSLPVVQGGNDPLPLAIAAPKQRLEEGIKAKHVLCFAPDFQLC